MGDGDSCVIVVRRDVLMQFQSIQIETSLDVNTQMEQFFQLYHCVKSVHVKIDKGDLDTDGTIILSDIFKKFASDYIPPLPEPQSQIIGEVNNGVPIADPLKNEFGIKQEVDADTLAEAVTLTPGMVLSQGFPAPTNCSSQTEYAEFGDTITFESLEQNDDAKYTPLVTAQPELSLESIAMNQAFSVTLIPAATSSLIQQRAAQIIKKARTTKLKMHREPKKVGRKRTVIVESLFDSEGIFIQLKDSYYCTVCNKHIFRASHAKRHMVVHTHERPFHCEQCSKTFARKDHLASHLKVHTGIVKVRTRKYTFTCKICNKTFKHSSHEKRHNRIHTGEKPFKCEECGRNFSRKEGYAYHIKTHINPKSPKRAKGFTCKVCNKYFHNPSHEERHMRTHTGETPFPCEKCDRSFSRKDLVKKHQKESCTPKVKANDSPKAMKMEVEEGYHCMICDIKFEDALEGERHMRKHSRARPWRCDKCGRTFGQQDLYTRHMESHDLPKTPKSKLPFPCRKCEQSFPTVAMRAKHTKTHKKMHKCDTCSTSFSKTEELTEHLTKCKKDKPVEPKCKLDGKKDTTPESKDTTPESKDITQSDIKVDSQNSETNS